MFRFFPQPAAEPKQAPGHGLVNELEAHVANFHHGLSVLEDDMHERHNDVQHRMAELEAEARALQTGLVDVIAHRKATGGD